MKHTILRRAAALLLSLLLALPLAACGGSQGGSGEADGTKTDDPQGTVPDEPFAYSAAAQAAIESLHANRAQELFAAAYLGCRGEGDTTGLAAWLQDNCPQMPAFWPFLTEIPEEDIIGEYGDLYCVVPLDEGVTFTVKGVAWETLGNGSMPHYSDPLYHAEVGRPFLLYVTHGDWRDETDLTVEYVQPDGFVGTWFPTYDTETGCLESWEKPGGLNTVLDFAVLYEIGDQIPHPEEEPDADSEWLPPTDIGLANTSWYSDNGWLLAFGEDGSAENGMVLYQPAEDGTLTPYDQGSWWMEDDSLCLGVYEGRCPFPLLISPSGEQLIVMQADDGSVLPFFERGQTTVGLTLSVG